MEYPPLLLDFLAAYERLYQAGDKAALFDAVAHCASYRLPVPEWARSALLSAHAAKAQLEITDWKDVFGDARPRMTQRLKKLPSAKIELLGDDIVMAAARARRSGKSPEWAAIATEVTDAHTEKTGEVLTLSAGTAKDVYQRRFKEIADALGAERARALAGNPKRGRKAR